VVVFVPATLMGATLPVLCRAFFDDPSRVGRSIGWLYAVNALGAVAGSLLAGFVLLPAIGQRATIDVGVAISLTVGTLAWLAGHASAGAANAAGAEPSTRAEPARSASEGAAARAPARFDTLAGRWRTAVLAGYGLSGLAAMVLQIAWTRVLSLAFGSSVYAFALLVAAFILGLAIGSALASRVADRWSRPVLAFAYAELGIGFTALAMVPVFERYPGWMLHLVPALAKNFAHFQLAQFALVFATLLLPTLCMGACLPFVGRALVRGLEHAAGAVGTAYAANAVGTIVGSFAGGFVLLPWLGMHRTILAGAAVNLLVGMVLLAGMLPRRRALPVLTGLAAAGALALALVPRFDPAAFTSGAYLYASQVAPGALSRGMQNLLEGKRLVLYREGAAATLSVKDSSNGVRSLVVNGKVDASDDGDMATQSLLGHVPCLLHPAPRDVAVIGLASGVTAHAVAQYPAVRNIDCVEIVPEMTEACRLFSHVNGHILDDPRLHLLIQDGRNHLALTDRSYDVIVSEPSNPWIAGIASLFTREFLLACRDRLRPGGIMCLWVQIYGLDAHAIRSLAATFQDVFPEASLWETIFASDYLLIGSNAPLQVGWGDLQARLAVPAIAADLAFTGVRAPEDVAVRCLTGPAGVRHLSAGGQIYRDDRNRLEFDAPRLMHLPTTLSTLRMLQELRRAGPPAWLRVPPEGLPPADQQALATVQKGQTEFWDGVVAKLNGDPQEATRDFLAALDDGPGLRDVWTELFETSRQTVNRALAARDTASASAVYRRMLAHQPSLAGIYDDYGVYLSGLKRYPAAVAAFRAALALRPGHVPARLGLAAALAAQGEAQAAAAEIGTVLAAWPDNGRAQELLARLRGAAAVRPAPAGG
jgi:spermidine synthase